MNLVPVQHRGGSKIHTSIMSAITRFCTTRQITLSATSPEGARPWQAWLAPFLFFMSAMMECLSKTVWSLSHGISCAQAIISENIVCFCRKLTSSSNCVNKKCGNTTNWETRTASLKSRTKSALDYAIHIDLLGLHSKIIPFSWIISQIWWEMHHVSFQMQYFDIVHLSRL